MDHKIQVAKEIIAKDGLWVAVPRDCPQVCCARPPDTTARLGIFSQISEYAKQANGGKNLPLWQKAACGLVAGGLGALCGDPSRSDTDRMQVRGRWWQGQHQ